MNKIKLKYIIGLFQSIGNLNISISKKNNKIWLSLKFNISLQKKDEKTIIAIKDYFNCGYYYINNKGICTYNVTNINDLINIIILFFIKYLLRGNKYKSFIMFKVIIDKLYNKEHYINNNILLNLINIAYNMNLLSNNLLRYLTESEKLLVLSKPILYNDLINKEYTKYYNNNLIDLDYIIGLFEGNGNINVYLTKNTTNSLRIKMYFNISQDKSILEEIQQYFNCGNIYNINNIYRYDVKSIMDIKNKIILKLINYDIELNIKLYKIKYINNIINWINKNNNIIINKKDIEYIVENIYYISNNKNIMKKEEYIREIMNKYKNIWNK